MSTPRPPDPAALDRPWTASYPPGVPPTYDVPTVPVTRLLDDAVRDFPDRPALTTGELTLDHVGVAGRVAQVADLLMDRGVQDGDRVLLAAPAVTTTPILLLAAWRLGAVAVPIAADLQGDRLVAIAEDAGISAVVGTRAQVGVLAQRGVLPDTVLVVDGDAWLAPRRRLGLPWRSGRVPHPRWGRDRAPTSEEPERLDAALSASGADATDRPARLVDPSALALLLYRPRRGQLRGVALTHRNLVAAAFQARLWVPDTQAGRERMLVVDGLEDLGALALGWLTGLLSAATVALLDEPGPAELARAIEDEQPTLLVTHPRRLARLLAERDADKRDLTSLRVVLTTGAPVDRQLGTDVERRTGGARIREGFGLAEAGPLTHAQPVYGRVSHTAMGLPVTSTIAVVVDPVDLGAVRPAGVPGLLLIHGPQVADGYWRDAPATEASFVEGWFVTDDLASVDADGVFTHIGRRDEVVVRDGIPVSPRHIEHVLEFHTAVQRAGVVVDPGSGTLLAAAVCRRRGRPSAEDLLVHCRAHLDSPAVPDDVTLVDVLPETETGELARDELRRVLVGGERRG